MYRRVFLAGAAGLTLHGRSWAGDAQKPAQRVLSIGGAVTEIVYALGEQDRLVARDATSTYPSDAAKLPDVGYMRQLSSEGVLSVEADLILAIDGAGPPETMDVLSAASIPVVRIPDDNSVDGIVAKVTAIGKALDVPERAAVLADRIRAELTAAKAVSDAVPTQERKRVLFVLSAQGGRIMAGGADTSADAVITLAGGINAAGTFGGYKHITDEAVALAAPDFILMMDRSGDYAITDEALFSMPAILPTPAARNRAIIRMNGLLLLGFGPRTAQAVLNLNAQLYGS